MTAPPPQNALYEATRGATVTAGFEVNAAGKVVRTAPILRRLLLGKSLEDAFTALWADGYAVRRVPPS